MDLDERVSRMEDLMSRCDPPPWVAIVEGRDQAAGESFIQTRGEDLYILRDTGGASPNYLDFIAEARNLLPDLIARYRELVNGGRCGSQGREGEDGSRMPREDVTDQSGPSDVTEVTAIAAGDLRDALRAVTEVVVSLDRIGSSDVCDEARHRSLWEYFAHDGGRAWLKLTETRRILEESALAAFPEDEVEGWAESWRYWEDENETDSGTAGPLAP
jgi:hypothetical protein